MFTLAEVYDLGIRIEKNAERFYREAMNQAWSAPIAQTLEMLAKEESEHVNFFLKKMDALKQKRENPLLDEISNSMLGGILGNEIFSLKEADISKIRSVEELVAVAIEFEKDTILFYEMIGSFMSDEQSKREIQTIVEEEERHVRLFESCREKATQFPPTLAPQLVNRKP